MSRRPESPSECPVCGAEVPRGARACPECGADERSGWDEDATRYDGLDLPGDPEEKPSARGGRQGLTCLWWAAGLLLLVVLAGLALGLFR